MRKIREVARLKASGLSIRQIAGSCGIARSTVSDYIDRLKNAGIAMPIPAELDFEELDRLLFTVPDTRGRDAIRPVPEWETIHKQLRGKAVTLQLLWEEYRENEPTGYSYSQFCVHYRRWAKTIDVSMRQVHRAGEKLYVDYAGMTMPLTDPTTGEVTATQIFVAALGASQYIYAEATLSQQLSDWVDSHVRTFEYLGGVPEVIVPDNLKSGVTKACRYDPDVNPTYADMARHYGVAVIPARPIKPKDKAKVESAVQIIERKILASLRGRTFFSLGELNEAIHQLLPSVNERPFQKLEGSRKLLFEQLDLPVLRALPAHRYQFRKSLTATVNIDYHVDVCKHYYSVPFSLRGQQVDVWISSGTIEILHRDKRVACHARGRSKGGCTTVAAHMPKAHLKHLEWTPSRLLSWAGSIGPRCAQVLGIIMADRPHPEQGYRACLGIMRLSKGYGAARVEAACHRAVHLDVCSYRSIQSILKSGKDADSLPDSAEHHGTSSQQHCNVRGRGYYETQTDLEARKALAHAE